MFLQGELKMRPRTKTVFSVKCATDSVNEEVDKKDYKVKITRGVTGEEMTYALVALLQVIMAHEESVGNKFSPNAFMNYIKMLLDDSKIGVPQDD